jgi:NTE family protein
MPALAPDRVVVLRQPGLGRVPSGIAQMQEERPLRPISFNANLLRELRAIDFVDDLIEDGVLGRSNAYKQVLLH